MWKEIDPGYSELKPITQNCKTTHYRVSQIAGVYQKMIFESSTLYHIMPFAKIIGPVEKNMTKSRF